MIEYTSGCGEDGQNMVNKEWEKLQQFLEQHSEFKDKAPSRKYKVSHDRFGGAALGMGAMATKRNS